MNLGRVLARTATSRAMKPAGVPWIVRRWLSVVAWPFGRRPK